MCYAFNKKNLLVFYEFPLDIMFSTFLTTLCVHASLWTYIIMIDCCLLRILYTQKELHFFWYPIPLECTSFIPFYSLVTPENICLMSACTHLLLKIFVSHACLGERVDSYVWLSRVLCCILQLVSSFGAQPYFYSKCLASLLFYDLLHLFCVLKDIWGVMIPYLCTLYSNAKILKSA